MPLGGVEEIGSNMTLIRTPDEDILIDCGMLFPYEECFDINYLVPDFSTLDGSRLRSIVITHGHEDHIGGLGQLLQAFPHLTVFATPFTLNLIRRKLTEFPVKLTHKLYNPGDELSFKGVDITPVHVNHSIPETCGLVIRSQDRKWGALYISDFKVDLSSKHEPPIDIPLIKKKLGECAHTAFFMDSTNVIYDGKTTSENDLTDGLREILERKEDRIYLTLFASNVHRMNAIAKMAKDTNRKIVLMGRSIRTYMEAAFETGHASISPEDLWEPAQVKGEKGRMLILLSGCQGDFLSALRRFSFGEDGNFKPTPNDVVVFSSKVIPGNEKKIYRIYNKLTEFGAEVVTASDHLIHASGHPGKEDLNILLREIRPDFYFPIHGESYMLRKHKEFIETSYPGIKTTVFYNYQEIVFGEGVFKLEAHEHRDPRLIHGKHLEIEKTQISQRRKLATQGAAFITYQRSSGHLQVTTLGLPLIAEDWKENLTKKLLKQIREDLHSREETYFKDQIRISTRQFYNNFLGYKPVTEVHLL